MVIIFFGLSVEEKSNHKIPLVKYWKRSYKVVVRELRAWLTRSLTSDCNCSSVMLMWNLLFKDVTVETPDLKQGSWHPERIISTRWIILSEYLRAATSPYKIIKWVGWLNVINLIVTQTFNLLTQLYLDYLKHQNLKIFKHVGPSSPHHLYKFFGQFKRWVLEPEIFRRCGEDESKVNMYQTALTI